MIINSAQENAKYGRVTGGEQMFKVTLHWEELETTTSFYNYEYALRELNFLVKESEKFRAKGFIKAYCVELKQED